MSSLLVTASDAGALAAHAYARQMLAARGEAELARGAANVGTVAALWVAATPVADATALATSVERLSGFVAAVEPGRRPHVAAMLDAALAAQTAARLAAGLPPHARRIDGWMAEVAAAMAGRDAAPTPDAAIPPRALARYASAGRADDVDAILLAVRPLLAALADAVRRGGRPDRHLDRIQAHALATCVWPPGTAADARDALVTVGILRRTLTRRRPFAAAILAAKLAADSR